MLGRISKLSILTLLILLQVSQLGLVAQENVDLSKLHPKFQTLVSINKNDPAFKKYSKALPGTYTDREGNARYGAIIKADEMQPLRDAGINLNSVYKDFATARVTVAELKVLSVLKTIRYVDAPSVLYPTMNVSLPETGAPLLHNGFLNNTAYKGDEAIVLIDDSGIDWRHLDFRDPDDSTKSRILAIWDQTITPTAGEDNPAGFSYGVEYTQADIEDELDGTPTGFVRESDPNGHGTHVAGTAAGSGLKFTGVAPEADIIVVKSGDYSFPNVNIIDGLTYAENKAASLGKPIVVNLSLGGHDGSHDGSGALEQVIDSFNSQQGQAAVVAAGNEGGDNIHISGIVSSGGSVTFQISVSSYVPEDGTDNDELRFNLWYDESATVTAKVTSPNGITFERIHNSWDYASNESDGKIYMENRRVDGIKQKILLWVNDESASDTPASGTWSLELSNASGDFTYDGWLTKSAIGQDFAEISLVNGDNDKTVGMPGTSNKAITVGAYVTKTSWPALDGQQRVYSGTINDIASFSSRGPTRDNRIKPEITAPGKGIVSALSTDVESLDIGWINPDGHHYLTQGTSMATPHVTGAVALLLANDPTYTADQIKSLLANSAVQDNFTGSVPNNTWGNGKMDILQAVISQLTTDTVVTKSTLRYDNEVLNSFYQLTGTLKLAVRFTAPHDGRLTGTYLQTLISGPAYNPIISGADDLLVSVYDDNAGEPGTQLDAVSHPLSLLDPGTINYIDIMATGISVTSGQNYHIVLSLNNASDIIKVLMDDGTTPRPDNPTHLYQGTWQIRNNNLRLESEITHLDYLNAIDELSDHVVRSFELYQNYPNPFNPTTRIRFNITNNGSVNLTIFDVLGREVKTLVDDTKAAGTYEVEWNGKDRNGYRVHSGIYFYRLKTNEGIISRKMLLVK